MMKSPSCSSSSSSTDSFLGQFAGSQFSRALPQAAFTFPSTWATKELMGPWNDRKVSSRVQFQESVVTSLVHAHLTQCEMFLQMQGYCEHIIRRPQPMAGERASGLWMYNICWKWFDRFVKFRATARRG